MATYQFRDGPRIFRDAKSADPQILGDAFEQIRRDNGGVLTVDAALERARDPANPLNKHVTWHDGEAAEKWRQVEMRQLILAVRVLPDNGKNTPPRRLYISLTAPPERGGRGYRSREQVIGSRELQLLALKEVERQLEGMERRFAEWFDLAKDLAELRQRVHERRAAMADEVGREWPPGFH